MLLLQMGARNSTCQLLGYCVWWVKEKGWGGEEKFFFGNLLLWGWSVEIQIRFVVCWNSFGRSVHAQRYEGFCMVIRTSGCLLYFGFVLHCALVPAAIVNESQRCLWKYLFPQANC